jgi:hypothetical protein
MPRPKAAAALQPLIEKSRALAAALCADLEGPPKLPPGVGYCFRSAPLLRSLSIALFTDPSVCNVCALRAIIDKPLSWFMQCAAWQRCDGALLMAATAVRGQNRDNSSSQSRNEGWGNCGRGIGPLS